MEDRTINDGVLSTPKLTTMINKMADKNGPQPKTAGLFVVVLTYCANLAVRGIQIQILQFYKLVFSMPDTAQIWAVT